MAPEPVRVVAGIVLAAGASTRMGGNKLFFELEGEALLRRAVRAAVSAGLDPVVVVLGHEAERARATLEDLACRPVLNPDYARGQGSSLRAGVAALPPHAAAAVVTLADMPFVTAGMIATVVERYRQGTAPLVVSDYGGTTAPPTLYDRSLFSEVLALEGEAGGRHVVNRHRDELLAVGFPAEALIDLDLPGDYERVKARMAQ